MTSSSLPVLYVTEGTAASESARDFLDGHGISHREVEVSRDPKAQAELVRRSGQEKTPTLVWHGETLIDFNVDQLVDFLHAHDVVLEDS